MTKIMKNTYLIYLQWLWLQKDMIIIYYKRTKCFYNKDMRYYSGI